MRRNLLAIFLVLLVACSSCDLSMLEILDGEKASEDTNTFIISEEYERASSFTMLLTSDQHFNREDSGVYYEDNLFLDWVSTYQSEHLETRLDLMVSLGDITDNSKTEEFQEFVSSGCDNVF
ncbi:MAG: hypothetical protein JEY71_15720 [Sphaerochaeta sp.]|nr:hypothetical protein [Sphaerochaeta sp.]